MKVVVWNIFLDHEKRERWINAMAAKGLILTDYMHYRYVFQEGKPGEYQYRLEMLPRRASNPESVSYIRFLEETGVEHMGSVGSWV